VDADGYECELIGAAAGPQAKVPQEYAIYTVSRHLDRTTKIAATFPEFVTNFCMGYGLLEYTGLGKTDDDPFDYDRRDYSPRW
jgi:hypothetical protein